MAVTDICPCCGRPFDRPELSRLLQVTLDYFGITKSRLRAHRRGDHLGELARWAFMTVAYMHTDIPRQIISAAVRRDETLVSYAVSRMQDNGAVVDALAREAGFVP